MNPLYSYVLRHIYLFYLQGYVLEILFTLESAIEWSIYDHSTYLNGGQGAIIRFNDINQKDLEDEEKDVERNDVASALPSFSASWSAASPLSDGRWRQEIDLRAGHFRSLSSGCDIRRTLGLYTLLGRNDVEAEEMMLRVRR